MFDKKSEREDTVTTVPERETDKPKPKAKSAITDFSDLEEEPEDNKELNAIHVVGELAEYVNAYLLAHNIPEETNSIIATVDTDKPIDNKKYLQIGMESPDYVYLGGTLCSGEQTAFRLYLAGRGIPVTANLRELVGWLQKGVPHAD